MNRKFVGYYVRPVIETVCACESYGDDGEYATALVDATVRAVNEGVSFKTFWSLYGRYEDEDGDLLSQCIGDFNTRAGAERAMEAVRKGERPTVDRDDYAEAAMCLWEAFLEAEIVRRPQDSFDLLEQSPPPHPYPNLHEMLQSHGTVTVRQDIMSLAEQCLRDWEKAVAEEGYDDPFDWEWCPEWLAKHDETLTPTSPGA